MSRLPVSASSSRRIEELQFRCEELERLLGMGPDLIASIQMGTGLSTIPARILGALYERHQVFTKEMLLTLIYGGMLDEPDMKIIDVFVCKMRQKLRPLGIDIKTIWGRGYILEAGSRARLMELIEANVGAKPVIHHSRRTRRNAEQAVAP